MLSITPRVHNKGREESVKLAIPVYNTSSEGNVTSGLAHVTVLNAKNSKFLLTMKKETPFVTFITFSGDTLALCDAC